MQEAEYALRELELKTISAVNLDGMPKGSSQGDASARHVIHLDYAKEKLERARKELDRAKRRAGKVCSRMEGHMRKFCSAYYIEGFPFDVAQMLSGVSERQCQRYMRDITDGIK